MVAKWIVLLSMSAAAFVGCAREAEVPATSANNCCQCAGVWNDPPTEPQSYLIAPDCQNATPGAAECTAWCKSLGHPSGGLASGSCGPAPTGNGSICQ